MPSRQYGKPINPENFGLTLRSIIERNEPQLAAFLAIFIGYHKRKQQEEIYSNEAIERMRYKMLQTLKHLSKQISSLSYINS